MKQTLALLRVSAIGSLMVAAACSNGPVSTGAPTSPTNQAPIGQGARFESVIPQGPTNRAGKLVGIEAPKAAKKGIYVADFDETAILGFKGRNPGNAPSVCSVPSLGTTVSIAVDPAGNLMVTDHGSNSVAVFAGPRMCGASLGTVSDPYGYPIDVASSDAKNGTIVIANQIGVDGNYPGNVALCSLSGGCTASLTNADLYQVLGVAVDRQGNCWISSQDNGSTGAHLIYFQGCSGGGVTTTGFVNTYAGGLDIDAHGNIMAISPHDPAIYVYSGCKPACTLRAGPLPLIGSAYYGHLNKKSNLLATGNYDSEQVDIYHYSPTSLTYMYSFNNGIALRGTIRGVAFNPRSKE